MSNDFHVGNYPVFKKGIFDERPGLFDRFIYHIPEHLKKKYQEGRGTLLKYEETITWPLITGPGFSGATHPGTENIFIATMLNPNSIIYNSDCLYVNPSQKVFAISDAPGVTTSSRKLFVELDNQLQAGSLNDIKTILNDLNKKIGIENSATLSLICFPKSKSRYRVSQALAFIAGDSYLFHGNILQKRMTCIEGATEFFGTPYIRLEPKCIELVAGDFFIIVSDGILSVRLNNKAAKLEEILWEYVNGYLENFALNIINGCNEIFEEKVFDKVITRFGGGDNVSALLVHPEELIDINDNNGFIYGGYIEKQAN